jgi:hypothetical protein
MSRYAGFKKWMTTNEGIGVFDIIFVSIIIGVVIGITICKFNMI